MAFPYLPGNQEATEKRLRYLYQLRNEIQQRNLHDNNLQSQSCTDITQADGTNPYIDGVIVDIGRENKDQHKEQTQRKVKHTAFSLLKPLRKLSLEDLSTASTLHLTKSLPKGCEESGYDVESQYPEGLNQNTQAKIQRQIETHSAKPYEMIFRERMLHETRRGLDSGISALNRQEPQYPDAQSSPSPYHRVFYNPPSSKTHFQLHHSPFHESQETSLEANEPLWSSNYPATEMFRMCSQAFTNPFSLGFVIDPTKLNSSSLLLSDIDNEQKNHSNGSGRIKVVDVGGRVSDEYVRRIRALPRVSVYKVVQKSVRNSTDPRTPTHFSELSQERHAKEQLYYDKDTPTLVLCNLAELPFATASVDVVIARCLYKNNCQATSYLADSNASLSTPNHSINETELCLQEFFRILSPGGCFEYVYFDRGLYNPQLLTAAMEPFFYEDTNQHYTSVKSVSSEVRNANEVPPKNYSYPHAQFEKSPPSSAADHQSIGSSADEFLSLVEAVGFTPVRNTVLLFPVTTLSALFTPEGLRRQTASVDDSQVGSIHDAGSVYKLSHATTELLKKIHQVCMASGTSWKCIVGWAKKL